MEHAERRRVSLGALAWYFLRLGLTGFGGPVALANYMRRDLAESRGWIDAREYDEGLAIATACPGPLAFQLGVYCGYITHGLGGALAVAVAFAAAPFAIVVGVAALYVHFGSTWQLEAIFYGVGPVVIAIIIRSCWDLGRKTLRGEWLAYLFAGVACAITIVVQRELVALFLIAGALGIVLFNRPTPPDSSQAPPPAAPPPVQLSAIASVAAGAYHTVALPQLFWFFFKTGLLVFGSGLVIVPFLKTYAVDQYHWISNRAFLDAVAVGIASPGPVVITATFVGYLTNRFAGAVAATVGIFTPSVIFVLLGTPILRRYRQNGRVQGFVRGITVAVVGVLLGTSYLVARSTIHDAFGALVLAAAVVALYAKWRIPEPLLVGAGAALGLIDVLVRGAH
ncbi:MAG: chromate efflux transporter [Candidatus Baltobacteraceae bacterium]